MQNHVRFQRGYILALVITCTIFLGGCGLGSPQYMTEYTLTPPPTEQGRTCVAVCEGNKHSCLANAESRCQMHAQQAEEQAKSSREQCKERRQLSYQTCMSESHGDYSVISSDCRTNANIAYGNCMTFANLDNNNTPEDCTDAGTSSCGSEYRSCYRQCGGHIQSKRVCYANCGKH